jgi:hypothetical protein
MLGDDVGYEPLVSVRPLSSDDCGVAHKGMPPQHRLDLSRLDPVASDLDLIIDSPDELYLTGQGSPHDVARAI